MYFHLDHANFMFCYWIISNLIVIFLLWWAASVGLGFLQFCNLNTYRSMFIIGFSLFMGLSVPQYFNEYLLLSGHGPVHTGSTAVRIYYLNKLTLILKILVYYSYLCFLWVRCNSHFAVQQHSASDFLIPSNCGNYSCLLLGFNHEPWRQLNSQR